MKRLMIFGLFATASWGQAQVVVRAPFVRVEVGGPGVQVRAPFVNLFFPNGPQPGPGGFIPPPGPGGIFFAPPSQPLPLTDLQPPTPPTNPMPPAAPEQSPAPAKPLPPGPEFEAPAPKEMSGIALEQFAKNFQPKAGNYEITIQNPVTKQANTVRFSLPGVPKQVFLRADEIEFNYGNLQYVKIKFDQDGALVISR